MSQPPVCTTKFKLNNGHELPAVGLGTWQGGVGTEAAAALEESIIHALKSGYRLIDTAQYYEVEDTVGRAILNSGVPREEICFMTKIWGDAHHDPAAALQKTLKDTGLDCVDMFLMHWPCALTPDGKTVMPNEEPSFVETWKKMEKLVGPQCKSIGVSNFTQKTMDILLKEAEIVPAINEVELHAMNPNFKLVPYCQEKGIQVVSWSTMGQNPDPKKNPLFSHEIFTSIGEKHGVSPGVVSLSWAVQRGIVVIPKSGNKGRIEGNIRLVTLSDEEMARVNSASETIGRHRVADGLDNMFVEIDGKNTIHGWTPLDFGWEDEQGNWLV